DMTAYIATFKCDYGQSGMIQGGESNITLPGANVLLPIYNEYVTLATDLKARKEALGMSPGIESELVLDAATSGLYDNKGTGINGTYTSLYRALTDEDGEDAAAWAAQKSDTASQLKTGAITAGAGALVGVVGNILINEVGDKPKELSDEIIAKYDAKRKTIREELEPVEEQSKSEATRNAPNVETNKSSTQKSADQLGCENSGGTWSNLSCTCPASKPQWDPTNRKCIEKTELIKSTITGLNIESGTTLLSKALAIPTNVTKGSPEPIVTLYNESMFDSGKTEIKNPTTKLDNVIEELKTKTADETDFEIVLVAHTDKDQIIPTSNLCKNDKICTNMELSQARANSVKSYIEKKWSNIPNTAKITVQAVGEACAKGTTASTKALDRRVDFYVFFDGEDSSKIEACKANQ
ncbi:MAG TPA: OmpA family protein, partial [Candidatus Enterousia avicola]|nr:OmpA family protein [Candidatus Enterousia avicola]